MGKKTPKQSPKKQPLSAPSDVAPTDVTAKTSKENMPKQKKTSKGSKIGHSNLLGAEGKKETMDERLARQKSVREALLEQGSHDNIEVITVAAKKMSVKGKRKEPKEGEEQGEDEEEEEGPHVWDFEESMGKLISLLDATVFVAEHDKVTETCSLLEGILLEEGTWKTTRELLDRVMSVNAELAAKVPHETTPRCVIYRMRKFIIDEFMTVVKDQIPESSTGVTAQTFFRDAISVTEIVPLDNYDIPDVPAGVDPVAVGAKVKQGLIAAIEEYKTELENIPNLIAAQGSKIIVEGDVIMTHSYCPSTAKLFLNAAEHCNFTLYVLESAPLCYGHLLVDDLEDGNIEVIITSDVSSGALMPNISKVIMPCRALLHTGDCKTQAFGATVAMAAAFYNKPVYCVAATYQFTPSMVPDVNQQLDMSFLGDDAPGDVPLIAHKFDLTDGKEVTKIVSNNAMLTPCQTQTHMAELYTPRLEKDELLAFNKMVV